MRSIELLPCQYHDPARGPFEPVGQVEKGIGTLPPCVHKQGSGGGREAKR